MNETDISWTDYTWNPTHGCSKVSPGCKNCYAEKISNRFKHTEKPWTEQHASENVQLKPSKLTDPANEEPGYVFVNSMSDLFHPEIPKDYIDRVFRVMAEHDQHTYQILTKRPGRAAFYDPPYYMPNVWIGTSIENSDVEDRIGRLRCIKWADKRFVSFEPLIGNVGGFGADLFDIDWVIVGGETAPDDRRREMKDTWVWNIYGAAQEFGSAWFFKQDSARYPETIRDHSREFVYREMPDGEPPPKPIEREART